MVLHQVGELLQVGDGDLEGVHRAVVAGGAAVGLARCSRPSSRRCCEMSASRPGRSAVSTRSVTGRLKSPRTSQLHVDPALGVGGQRLVAADGVHGDAAAAGDEARRSGRRAPGCSSGRSAPARRRRRRCARRSRLLRPTSFLASSVTRPGRSSAPLRAVAVAAVLAGRLARLGELLRRAAAAAAAARAPPCRSPPRPAGPPRCGSRAPGRDALQLAVLEQLVEVEPEALELPAPASSRPSCRLFSRCCCLMKPRIRCWARLVLTKVSQSLLTGGRWGW